MAAGYVTCSQAGRPSGRSGFAPGRGSCCLGLGAKPLECHNTINSNRFLVGLQSNKSLHQVLNTYLPADLAAADLAAADLVAADLIALPRCRALELKLTDFEK